MEIRKKHFLLQITWTINQPLVHVYYYIYNLRVIAWMKICTCKNSPIRFRSICLNVFNFQITIQIGEKHK